MFVKYFEKNTEKIWQFEILCVTLPSEKEKIDISKRN